MKILWGDDEIDCHKIQWRDFASANIKTMNGALTFKQQFPDEYAKIIDEPIGKTTWKYLRDDELICERFTANPNLGHIGIPRFPKLPNQVNNVISKILTNN